MSCAVPCDVFVNPGALCPFSQMFQTGGMAWKMEYQFAFVGLTVVAAYEKRHKVLSKRYVGK